MKALAIVLGVCVALGLVGCKNSREEAIPGMWELHTAGLSERQAQAAEAFMMTLTPEHRYSMKIFGAFSMSGSWRLRGDTMELTPGTINGEPIAQFVSRMRPQLLARPGGQRAVKRLEDIGKPMRFVLSSDGYRMTSVDGDPFTLVKTGG